MGESESAVSRRDALKTAAKVAGVAAFATPTVVGVFAAPSFAAETIRCNPATESDAITGILVSGDLKRNQNCGNDATPPAYGRYNAQDAKDPIFDLDGQTVTVNIGEAGIDNYDVEVSFYTIDAPANLECVATFTVNNCDRGDIIDSDPPTGTLPLPYCLPTGPKEECQDNANANLELLSVVCCPV